MRFTQWCQTGRAGLGQTGLNRAAGPGLTYHRAEPGRAREGEIGVHPGPVARA